MDEKARSILRNFYGHEAEFNKLIALIIMHRRPNNSAILHVLTRIVGHAQKSCEGVSARR